jgi:hypothetical protein
MEDQSCTVETFVLETGERLVFVVDEGIWTMMSGLRNWLGTNRPDVILDGNRLTLVSRSATLIFDFVKRESEAW